MSALDISLKGSDKPFAFKAATSASPAGTLGYLEGYCSVFGNVDSHNERVMPGAFTDTIVNEGGQGLIKLFYDHECPLGTAEEVKQDDYGLWIAGYVVDSEDTKECVAHIGTTARHASFAYSVQGDVLSEDGVRNLTKLKVYEGGPVLWPSNRRATMGMRKAFVKMGLIEEDVAPAKAEEWGTAFAELSAEVKAALEGFRSELKAAILDPAEVTAVKEILAFGERLSVIESKISSFQANAEKASLDAALGNLESAISARTKLLKGVAL